MPGITTESLEGLRDDKRFQELSRTEQLRIVDKVSASMRSQDKRFETLYKEAPTKFSSRLEQFLKVRIDGDYKEANPLDQTDRTYTLLGEQPESNYTVFGSEFSRTNLNPFPTNHPMVKNADGSVSNVLLMSETFSDDEGRESTFVIPTMVEGKKLSRKAAVDLAKKYGLGEYPRFDTKDEAEAWIQENHSKIPPPEEIQRATKPRERILTSQEEFLDWLTVEAPLTTEEQEELSLLAFQGPAEPRSPFGEVTNLLFGEDVKAEWMTRAEDLSHQGRMEKTRQEIREGTRFEKTFVNALVLGPAEFFDPKTAVSRVKLLWDQIKTEVAAQEALGDGSISYGPFDEMTSDRPSGLVAVGKAIYNQENFQTRKALERDFQIPVKPPESLGEKISDVGAGLSAFVAQILLLKKISPIKQPVLKDMLAWEIANTEGPVGQGAAMSGALQVVGKVGRINSMLGLGALGVESAGFASLIRHEGGNLEDQVIAGLIPVVFRGLPIGAGLFRAGRQLFGEAKTYKDFQKKAEKLYTTGEKLARDHYAGQIKAWKKEGLSNKEIRLKLREVTYGAEEPTVRPETEPSPEVLMAVRDLRAIRGLKDHTNDLVKAGQVDEARVRREVGNGLEIEYRVKYPQSVRDQADSIVIGERYGFEGGLPDLKESPKPEALKDWAPIWMNQNKKTLELWAKGEMSDREVVNEALKKYRKTKDGKGVEIEVIEEPDGTRRAIIPELEHEADVSSRHHLEAVSEAAEVALRELAEARIMAGEASISKKPPKPVPPLVPGETVGTSAAKAAAHGYVLDQLLLEAEMGAFPVNRVKVAARFVLEPGVEAVSKVGAEGKVLAEQTLKYHTEGRVNAAPFVERMYQLVKEVPKQDRDDILKAVNWLGITRGRRLFTKKGELKTAKGVKTRGLSDLAKPPKTPAIKRAAEFYLRVSDAQLRIFGEERGGLRTMLSGKRIKAAGGGVPAPQRLSAEGEVLLAKALGSIDSEGRPNMGEVRKNALVQEMIKTGLAKNETRALRMLSAYSQERRAEVISEFQRSKIPLPAKYLEWNFEKIFNGGEAFERMFVRNSMAKVFGPEYEKANQLLLEIGRKHGPEVRASVTKWWDAIVKTPMGPASVEGKFFSRTLPGWLSTYQTIFRLNPFTTVMNALEGMKVWGDYSLLSALAGTIGAFTKKGWRTARLSGAVPRDITRYGLVGDVYTPQGRRLATWWLRYIGFEVVEKVNNVRSSLAMGHQFLRDVETLKNPPEGLKSIMRWIYSAGGETPSAADRRLARHGLTGEQRQAIKDRGYYTWKELKTVRLNAAENKNFRAGPMWNPSWWNRSPWARALLKFKIPWGWNQYHRHIRMCLAEAKHGNMRPLMSFTITSTLAGELYNSALDAMTDRDRSDQPILERLMWDFVQGGGWGIFGGLWFAKDLPDVGKNLFFGPSGKTVENIYRTGRDIKEVPDRWSQHLDKFFQRENSTYKQAHRIVDRVRGYQVGQELDAYRYREMQQEYLEAEKERYFFYENAWREAGRGDTTSLREEIENMRQSGIEWSNASSAFRRRFWNVVPRDKQEAFLGERSSEELERLKNAKDRDYDRLALIEILWGDPAPTPEKLAYAFTNPGATPAQLHDVRAHLRAYGVESVSSYRRLLYKYYRENLTEKRQTMTPARQQRLRNLQGQIRKAKKYERQIE